MRNQAFADILDYLRQKNTILQILDIAKHLGVDRSVVWRWFNGETYPRADRLRSLAALLCTNEVERKALYDVYDGRGKDWKERLTTTTSQAFAPPEDFTQGQRIFERLPTSYIPNRAPLQPGSRMLLAPNPLFVGRDDELLTLAATIKQSDAVVVIAGMAGVGKTQLASEYVHRYGQFFSGGVFWMSFADPQMVATEIAACGSPEGLDIQSIDQLPLAVQVQRVQKRWQSGLPCLLIFDNCEDEELVAEWRPRSGTYRVLITSRRTQWSPTLATHVLPLPVLQRNASIMLLQRHRTTLPEDNTVLDAIAAELGDLPLALHQVRSLLTRFHRVLTPSVCLQQLRDQSLIQDPLFQSQDISPTKHEQNILRTFTLSCEQLNPANPTDVLARALLARAAYFAPGERLPRTLLLASSGFAVPVFADQLMAEQALERIRDHLGLLQEETDGALRMHRLVATIVRFVLNDSDAQADVERILRDEGMHLADIGKPAPPDFLHHLYIVTDTAKPRRDERAADLCVTFGHLSCITHNLAVAKDYIEWALEVRKEVLPADSNAIFECYELLAWVHHSGDNYSLARQLYEQVLSFHIRVNGPNNLKTAGAYRDLAVFLMFQGGDYRCACRYIEQGLKIFRKHSSQSGNIARNLRNLGYAHLKLGNYQVAHRYLRRAIRIFTALERKEAGSYQIAKAQTLVYLGDLCYEQGRYDQALRYLEQSKSLREIIFGQKHSEIAETFWHMGRIYTAIEKYDVADDYFDRALDINMELLTPIHYELIRIQASLGYLRLLQRNLASARSYLGQALTNWKLAIGENHPETAVTIVNLGLLAQAEGNSSGARFFFQKALAIQNAALGPRHPITKRTRKLLNQIE